MFEIIPKYYIDVEIFVWKYFFFFFFLKINLIPFIIVKKTV